eukprot:4787935-Alexandrium_andersonii.AAC.1
MLPAAVVKRAELARSFRSRPRRTHSGVASGSRRGVPRMTKAHRGAPSGPCVLTRTLRVAR